MSFQTKGQQILSSEKINKLIKELSNEVHSINKQIFAPKPPETALVDSYKAIMERVSVSRGRPLYHPYVGSSSGHGVYVELEDGSVKLDLINGIGIHIMGHSNPKLIEAALRGAVSDIVMQGNLEPNKEYLQMTERLVSLASKKSRLKYAWLSTCGTMANENALKMARQKNSPARMIVAFKDAFAGRSTLMAEVTDNPAYKMGLPEYNEVLRLPFYDKKADGPVTTKVTDKYLSILKEHYAKHEKNICAFVFEPMQGEGGYKAGNREFFAPLFDFCKEKHIAIWADEVQTFTRTGEFFAFETLGIGEYIDLCTIAKTAQVGATLYTEEYNPKPGLIAGTFSGSTVSLSVGLEILRILEDEGYVGPNGRISKINQLFVDGLNQLNETTCKGQLSDAGGLGLMIAVTPYDGNKDRTEALIKRMFQNGLIAFGCGKDPYRIRFLVPAVITDQDIQVALKIIEKSILEEMK
jgi:acetylornithine/N-succinyldiaminopimelate aminotransferase